MNRGVVVRSSVSEQRQPEVRKACVILLVNEDVAAVKISVNDPLVM